MTATDATRTLWSRRTVLAATDNAVTIRLAHGPAIDAAALNSRVADNATAPTQSSASERSDSPPRRIASAGNS